MVQWLQDLSLFTCANDSRTVMGCTLLLWEGSEGASVPAFLWASARVVEAAACGSGGDPLANVHMVVQVMVLSWGEGADRHMFVCTFCVPQAGVVTQVRGWSAVLCV